MARARTTPGARPTGLRTAAETIAPARGREPSIEFSNVVRLALEIVDAEGLGALTLRRLARELGVGVSTVHAAVGSKEDLLTALTNAVMHELPPADDNGDPVDTLVHYLEAFHRRMLEHPAIAQLSSFRQSGGQSARAVQENLLSLLHRAGVPDDRIPTAYTTLTSYVLGFTLRRIPREEAPELDTVDSRGFPRVRTSVGLLESAKSDDQLRAALRLIIEAYLNG